MGFSITTWRQISVVLASQLGALSIGGDIGYPTVLLQQIKYDDNVSKPDVTIMSWIASVGGIAGIGAMLMPTVTQRIGRKYTFIGCCVTLIVGWFLAFMATHIYAILLAEVFLGLGGNCTTIVNLIIVSEMMSPTHRTLCMMTIGISQSVGIILVSLLGTIAHWKKIALAMCSPLVVAIIIVTFLPESPAWLAYKKKYDKCEKSFTWLRGTGNEANKELQILMESQKLQSKTKPKQSESLFQEIAAKIKMVDFYMPVLHMLLVLVNFYICGGVSLLIYNKYIISLATGNEKVAMFGYLFVNFTLFFGGIISIFLIKYVKSKTVICISSVGNVFLLLAALVSFLQNTGLIAKHSLIFVYFFIGFFIFLHSGANVITFAISVELIPVEHRGLGGALYTTFTCTFHFTTTKLLPYLITYINISGTLLLYGIGGIISTLLIKKYVPETKGRTLKEIEDFYSKNNDHTTSLEDLKDKLENMPMFRD